MSAAELRQAAETLRKRANAATPGPWGFTDSEAAATLVNLPDDGMVVLYDGDTAIALCADEFYENEPGEPAPFNDAQWIATMHPGVGLALADVLGHEAEHVASHDCEAHCAYPDGGPRCHAALRLARLINGGAS